MKNFLMTAALLSAVTMTACISGSSDSDDPAKDYAWARSVVETSKPGDLSGITPYGKFQRYTYFSRTAGRDTNMNVLLPPNYSKDKQYPVLYILHGYYDDETWMARDVVGIPQMLTKLYAEKKAKGMIVVLPYIFTSKEMARVNGMNEKNNLAYDNFINDLVTDVMPFVEKTFSVKKGRKNTAITGFSMGGRESLFIAFQHPELFYYVAGVESAPGLVSVANSPMHSGQMKKEDMKFPAKYTPKFFLLSSAGNGGIGGSSASYHAIMNDNGVKHIWKQMPGTSHNHTSVQPHLYDLFQIIFQ